MKNVVNIILTIILILSVLVFFVGCDWYTQSTHELKGENGDKGDNGAGIQKIELDKEGSLVIILTDGTVR